MRTRHLAMFLVLALSGCGGHYSLAPVAQNASGSSPSEIQPELNQTSTNSLHWKQFTPKTISAVYREIVAGPDNNLWFADNNGDRIVRMRMDGSITEFLLTLTEGGHVYGFAPTSIAVGADAKFYMICDGCADPITGGGLIGVTTTTGGFVKHNTPSKDSPTNDGLGLGPDGNIWFAERAHIAKITTSGVITEFAYPSKETQNIDSHPIGGPDGNVWFTEYFKHKVAKINPTTHAITEFDVLSKCSGPHGMARGPDGNLYFVCASNLLGKITTAGAVSTISNPAGISLTAEDIALGPDGHIWFSTANSDELGDYNTSTHLITYHTAPFRTGLIIDIAKGPDGNVWGTEGAFHVDVYILATLTVTPKSLTFTSVGRMQTLTASYTGPSTLTAASASTAIATVAPGITKNMFVVTSRGAGKTTVTIRDAIGNSVVVPVTVQ